MSRPARVRVSVYGLKDLEVDRPGKNSRPDEIRPVGDAGRKLPTRKSRKPQRTPSPQHEQRRPDYKANGHPPGDAAGRPELEPARLDGGISPAPFPQTRPPAFAVAP